MAAHQPHFRSQPAGTFVFWGDGPEVVPAGAKNFAFLGQFVEVAHDCVFTVEYSVRTAQTAIFGLLDGKREVSPLYRGDHDIHVLLNALQALAR